MLEKSCPNKDNLKLFLEGETSVVERDQLESHLADCDDCRQSLSAIFTESLNRSQNFKAPDELVEKVKNIPETDLPSTLEDTDTFENPHVPWYRQNFLQIAFATCLLVFVGISGFYFFQFQQSKNSDDIFRSGTSNRNLIQLISPKNNADISGKKISFSWNKITGAKNYIFTLSDEKGDIIKEVKTEKLNLDTSASELGLTVKKYYFWQIKTRLADGSIAESELRKFSNKN